MIGTKCGLTRLRMRTHTRVDYPKSVAEVYTDAARCILRQGILFTLIGKTGRSESCHDLPCFIPDWPGRSGRFYFMDDREYRAGGDSKPSTLLSKDGKTLW
jgi:hypothetical protein